MIIRLRLGRVVHGAWSLGSPWAFLSVLVGIATAPPARLDARGLHADGASLVEAAPEVTFISPMHGDVVPAVLEVQLRTVGVTEDIHLLVTDTAAPLMYRYVERITALPARGTETLTRLVDTTTLGTTGTIRLVAVSINRLALASGGLVDPRAIPASAPIDGVEVRHAGAVLSPTGGGLVGIVDTVRAQGFLPNSYLAVAVRPVNEGAYWVQNNGILVSPATPIPIRAQFGGAGVYHLYLGVTYDRELFEEGDRFIRLPEKDRAGRRVYWIGPVEVTHP